jgi:hypothetical protein
MPPAIATFDDPFAWLIRGLVEYGWPDTTRAGGYLPGGVFGGFNLQRLLRAEGREGLELEVPAVADHRVCEEDGVYRFTVQVARKGAGLVFAVRCPPANYLQEFPYDPENPLWAAGYLHQGLAEYVPEFVRWRLAGGEVSVREQQGLPQIAGEPCPWPLLQLLKQKVEGHQRLDLGPSMGWWIAGAAPTAPPVAAGRAPVAAPSPSGGGLVQAIASVGKGGGEPVYISAAGRADGVGVGGAAGVGIGLGGAVQAEARLRGPARALYVTSAAGALQGVLWLFNGVSVLAVPEYRSQIFALAFSLVASVGLVVLGAVSAWGARCFQRNQPGPFPWVAIAYAALTPGCCLAGVPVAIAAARAWTDGAVTRARGG